MAIIRDNPEDWTAQLTGEELIMYLVLHFKMEPEDAEQQVKEKEDGFQNIGANMECPRLHRRIL